MVEKHIRKKKKRNEGVTLVPVVRSAVLLTHRIAFSPSQSHPKTLHFQPSIREALATLAAQAPMLIKAKKKVVFKGNRNTMNKSGETFGDLRLFVLETCQVAAVLAGGAWSKKPKALAALGALGEPEC
jgi:hypothetical protein